MRFIRNRLTGERVAPEPSFAEREAERAGRAGDGVEGRDLGDPDHPPFQDPFAARARIRSYPARGPIRRRIWDIEENEDGSEEDAALGQGASHPGDPGTPSGESPATAPGAAPGRVVSRVRPVDPTSQRDARDPSEAHSAGLADESAPDAAGSGMVDPDAALPQDDAFLVDPEEEAAPATPTRRVLSRSIAPPSWSGHAAPAAEHDRIADDRAHDPQALGPAPDEEDVAEARAQLARAAGQGLPVPAAPPTGQRHSTRAKTRILGFQGRELAARDPFAQAASDTPADAVHDAAGLSFPVGWIVVVEGPGRGASFTLQSGVSSVGRGEDQVVRLDFGDTSISRQNHASIAYDDEAERFFLGHGGKSNLVRLNGRPVLSTEDLNDGDIIRIGETSLRFAALCKDGFTWGLTAPAAAPVFEQSQRRNTMRVDTRPGDVAVDAAFAAPPPASSSPPAQVRTLSRQHAPTQQNADPLHADPAHGDPAPPSGAQGTDSHERMPFPRAAQGEPEQRDRGDASAT